MVTVDNVLLSGDLECLCVTVKSAERPHQLIILNFRDRACRACDAKPNIQEAQPCKLVSR